MNYSDVIRDFTMRTRKNLEFIEKHQADGEDVFEVTQLVNSMLGLLVFPEQHYFSRIPEIPLSELEQNGWPKISVTKDIQLSPDFHPCHTLKDLIRYLRNAISHFNLRFLTGSNEEITGLRVWNINDRLPQRPKTWEAELSLADLKAITLRFTELLENNNSGERAHG